VKVHEPIKLCPKGKARIWAFNGQEKTERWDAGVVMCMGQGADLHMAQMMPLPFTISCSSKFRLVLPFWCRLTRVVPDKIQDGRKTVVF